ncbi:hypothetical protein BV898_12329 [Hypsibius exemplaris]|uniref:Uncharacterized protein n=1 Tax=Hypsibius exemplaris TaxID=2072580 RepID=A0A1W0WE76_HYPEX|nr:hypothetical protein BV898_12329 [Hypsibius exemplaris]
MNSSLNLYGLLWRGIPRILPRVKDLPKMALPPNRPTNFGVDLSSDSGVSESDSGTPPSDAPVTSPDLPQNHSGITTTIPPKLQPGSQDHMTGTGNFTSSSTSVPIYTAWKEDESKEDEEEEEDQNLDAEIAVVERALELALERKRQQDENYIRLEKGLQQLRMEIRLVRSQLGEVAPPPLSPEQEEKGRLICVSIVYYCREKTYERLAVTLVLIGPAFLEYIVDTAFLDRWMYYDVTNTELKTVQLTALRILSRHKEGWNSAELINNNRKVKTVCELELPPPGWDLSPRDRVPELFRLCAENTYDRLCVVLTVLGWEYFEELELSLRCDVPEFSCESFERIHDAIGKVRDRLLDVGEDFAEIFDEQDSVDEEEVK